MCCQICTKDANNTTEKWHMPLTEIDICRKNAQLQGKNPDEIPSTEWICHSCYEAFISPPKATENHGPTHVDFVAKKSPSL